MNISRLLIVGIGVMSMSACATTSDQAQASQEVAPAATPAASPPSHTVQFAEDRMVCKKKTLTGSRFAKKVCMTATQWAKMEANAKKTTQDLQNRGGRTNQPTGN